MFQGTPGVWVKVLQGLAIMGVTGGLRSAFQGVQQLHRQVENAHVETDFLL